jgi:hypothetical protein
MSVRLVLFVALLSLVAGSPAAAQDEAAPPPPCSAPEHRQFDFWLGEWDVTANGKTAGKNRITAILGGCVLMEEWASANGKYAGKSFNRYDTSTGKWEQYWVDTGGGVLRLSGGYSDGKMVLNGETNTEQGATLERITWHNNADGTVRQVWEKSKDNGDTWKAVFDGLYVKKAE